MLPESGPSNRLRLRAPYRYIYGNRYRRSLVSSMTRIAQTAITNPLIFIASVSLAYPGLSESSSSPMPG
jgi:hypothetical protein